MRRDRRLKRPHATFESLIGAVGKELEELGYDQHPVLIAPTEVKKHEIPLTVD